MTKPGFLLLAGAFLGGAVAAQSAPFRALEESIPPASSTILAAADLDGDGDRDLLCNGAPEILLNDGSGRFTPGRPSGIALPSPNQPVPEGAVADFDGDGDIDVLAALPGGGMTLWVNAGNAVFTSNPAIFPLTLVERVSVVVAGDVDGDGDMDAVIAIANTVFSIPAPFLLLRNQGGSFTLAPAAFPPAPVIAFDAEFADLDADGDLDLAASIAAILGVYWNDGTGIFSQGAVPLAVGRRLAVGDVDGDGRPDLVGAEYSANPGAGPGSSVRVLLNAGSGTFTGPVVGGDRVFDAGIADIDADGVGEIVFGRGGRFTQVAKVLPSGTLFVIQDQLAPAGAILTADVDGDGDRDVLAASNIQQRVLLNAGDGQLHPIDGGILASDSSGALAVGDFDGDGDVDIVTQDYSIALNDGEGHLRWSAAAPCGTSCNASLPNFRAHVVAFDADGDGDLDLCLTDAAGSSPLAFSILPDQIFLNGGGPTWTPGMTFGLAGSSRKSLAGDLDGNGSPDLLVLRRTPNPGSIWPTALPAVASEVRFNTGGGTFSGPGILPSVAHTMDAVLADFDGDGDLDIVAANAGPGETCELLRNGGTGAFTRVAGALPFAAWEAEAGDLDGDGDQDLVLDGTWWINAGNASFSFGGAIPGFPNFSGNPLPFSVFDADADGDPDVVAHDGRLFRNLGSGPGPAETLGFAVWSMQHADFDRDGDEDIVVPGPLLLTNVTRQLAYELPARLGRTASLDLHGPPGAPWLLFGAAGAAAIPASPFGTILIDPAGLLPVGNGSFGATGRSTISAFVPATPSLAGATILLQGVVGDAAGPRLTNRRTVTVNAF